MKKTVRAAAALLALILCLSCTACGGAEEVPVEAPSPAPAEESAEASAPQQTEQAPEPQQTEQAPALPGLSRQVEAAEGPSAVSYPYILRTEGAVWHLSADDMELLGRKEFIEPEYGDKASCRFVLPTLDGGCLVGLLTYFVNNGHRSSKLIKMRREDFTPIPCSVKELPQETIQALAYPNPAREKVTIDGIEVAEVQIYNALGQVVKTVRNSNEIKISDLTEGVYLLRITDAKGVSQTERITVIR